MTFEIKELDPHVIGQKLGSDFYNPNGNILLRQGVEITPSYYSHFEKSGYKSIYLLTDQIQSVKRPEHLLADHVLPTVSERLKEIFRMLKCGDRSRAAKAQSDLLHLAETILENLNLKTHKQSILLDLKRQDDYLYQHSVNVAVFSAIIAKRLGYDEGKLLSLTVAALLHDFGMIFIEDEIVNKTTQLEDKEYEAVKEHTVKGFKHLFNYGFVDPLCGLASVQHHENFDGSGYPNRLSGADTHEFCRIISLTDFFDAWTSDRPHRRLHSIPEATDFIRRKSNSMFDPKLADVLIDIFE